MIGEWSIDYGAKRPLKFQTYAINSEEREWFFEVIYEFVVFHVNIETYNAMDEVKQCRLIEKIAIMLCKAESPTRKYDIKKAEIRSAIRYWIRSLSEASYRGKEDHRNED